GLTAFLSGVGLIAGCFYVNYARKQAKKINKQIDAMDEEYLIKRQEKISDKISEMNQTYRSLQTEISQAENKNMSVIVYKTVLQRKNGLSQKKAAYEKTREEISELEIDIKNLKAYQTSLQNELSQKEKNIAPLLKQAALQRRYIESQKEASPEKYKKYSAL